MASIAAKASPSLALIVSLISATFPVETPDAKRRASKSCSINDIRQVNVFIQARFNICRVC
jgi:hypothetical protein